MKSFDGPYNRFTTERALRDVHIGTCVSISWDLREIPKLNVAEHLLFDAKNLKYGRYPDVRWPDITPLDEELIENMRHSECVFIKCITRNALEDIPYTTLRRQYFDHLRFWNHIIETKKIDFMLLNHPPHQGYDIVIYDLCRLKKIQTLLIDRCHCINIAVFPRAWEKGATDVRDVFYALKEEYRDPSRPIPLSEKCEHIYRKQTVKQEGPAYWYMAPRPKYLTEKNFVRRWLGIALQMAVRRPLRLLYCIMSPGFWARKLRDHRIIQMYDNHVGAIDFAKPYVYVPLHVQPESTTCPIGGAFVDQERVVQLLAAHLPKGVPLYVKEHPNQREEMRSCAFYQSLIDIPSVTLAPRETSTMDLIENSAAVATVSGTAGFEALFRQKPVLLFGHCFYQYASGVHMIRSAADCRRAIDRILVQKEKPALRDARLYLKAIEACGSTYEGAELSPNETETVEQQAVMLGEHLAGLMSNMQEEMNRASGA